MWEDFQNEHPLPTDIYSIAWIFTQKWNSNNDLFAIDGKSINQLTMYIVYFHWKVRSHFSVSWKIRFNFTMNEVIILWFFEGFVMKILKCELFAFDIIYLYIHISFLNIELKYERKKMFIWSINVITYIMAFICVWHHIFWLLLP